MFDWLSVITKRSLSFCLALLFVSLAIYDLRAANEPSRPRILGIAGVRFFSTDIGAARSFYTQILDAKEISPNAFAVNPQQAVTLFDTPSPIPSSLLAEVVFETDDLATLLRYLQAQKIEVTPKLVSGIWHWDMSGLGYSALSLVDPEGYRISFVKRTKPGPGLVATKRPSTIRLIHAGFVVHDREAEDKFYKDILGFHVYWHGGMKEGEDNWVDMQVPDGTDWLEYMLKVPDNASHKTLGVMNHIALGVPDIHKAQEQLIKNGWKGEEPKIGRDGKWQLNLYDPDETRVELMEFTPTKDPCCSPYTGPHPHQ